MKKTTVFLGKAVRNVARLRGGGSALPGAIVEKIDPDFLKEVLNNLPYGVAVVSGTNGKTTTTKIIVELLESQGLKVFTNRTGSNFTRGVISEIIGEIQGGCFDFDIAVLELDEAYAARFVDQVQPNFSLILNVFRDQLDRFGEIDKTAKLLEKVAKKTKKEVILNREDRLVSEISNQIKTPVAFFGHAEKLAENFPVDDETHTTSKRKNNQKHPATVELIGLKNRRAEYQIDGKKYLATLKLSGSHNALNGAAALAIVQAILGEKFDATKNVKALAKVEPAFGRGEIIEIGKTKLELLLVKNPSGFQSALRSQYKKSASTMIAINDQYADGRDMSWLWDVDFHELKKVTAISGIRAYDMALRLQYDDVDFKHVATDLKKSLKYFLSKHSSEDKQIFCTYTAMLAIRKILAKSHDVRRVL